MNTTGAAKSIFLALLFVTTVMCTCCQSWAGESINSCPIAGPSVASQCTEDPSCVVVGGTHLLEWRSASPAKIVAVCIHGLGLCARAYEPLAQELSAAGIDGFGVNVRGFGPDRADPARSKLDCVKTVGDVIKLLTGIRRDHPDYKIILIGESMGGALAIRIAAENPHLVDGVLCSAPAWKLLKVRRTAVKGIFELLLAHQNSPGLASRGVMKQATSDQSLTRHWLSDPSHKLKLSLKEATSFINFISKTDTYAKKLTKPVLIVQGLNDHLVPAGSVAKLFKDVRSDNKRLLIAGKAEHLILEEGRFSPKVAAKLISWLKEDAAQISVPIEIEIIDAQELSPKERRRLSKLIRLAGGDLHRIDDSIKQPGQ